MKKDDYLGLFLRCLGAWEVMQSIGSLSAILAAPAIAIFLVPRLIAGFILFFCAGFLVEWTYGKRPAEVGENT